MKKVFAIFTLLLAGVVSAYGTTNGSNESDKEYVELKSMNLSESSDRERSVEYSVIEAYLYPGSGIVEVTLYNIGCATVSLIDSNNQTVCSETVETEVATTVYLTAPTVNGTYNIVIASSNWYAEGVVEF